MTLPSLRRHPRRHRGAVPRAPHHRGAEGALAAEVLLRRAAHRDRHDRARRRLRPGQPQDHRGPRRRRLGHQRLQDVHHQRRQRRPGGGRRAHRPEKKAKGISLFGVDTSLDGFSVGRVLDKVGQDESDTAELAFEDVRVSNDDLIGELDTGFISMMQFLPQERLGSAITNLAHAAQILDETIQYAKDRKAFGQPIGSLPAQPVPDRRAGHPGRGHPGLRRPVRPEAHPRRADRRSTRPRPSGGPRRSRTTCSTTASSCTAATAT